MSDETPKRKKIIVKRPDRKNVTTDRTSGRRLRETSLSDDNPMLSQPPSSSTAYKMMQRQQEEAKIQNRMHENTKQFHGLTPERETRDENDNSVHSNSFVSKILNRFR